MCFQYVPEQSEKKNNYWKAYLNTLPLLVAMTRMIEVLLRVMLNTIQAIEKITINGTQIIATRNFLV